MAAESEVEKMAAVKQAYAEMIYNLEKQSAVREMAAEMRAHRLQQDISATNKESLRLLVRFKRMIDTKATEAKMAFTRRQSKIDELEEQLEEAEGIIVDVRAELKWVRDKLDKVRNNRCHPSVEQNVEENFSKARPGISNTSPNSPLQLAINSGLDYIDNRASLNGQLVVPQIENVSSGSPESSLTKMGMDEFEISRSDQTIKMLDGSPGDLINRRGLIRNELVSTTNSQAAADCHVVRTAGIQRSFYPDDLKYNGIRRSRRRKARFGKSKAKCRSLQSKLILKPYQPPSIFSWKKTSSANGNAKPSSDFGVIDMKGSGELAEISKHNGGCFKNEKLMLSGEHSQVCQRSTLGQCRTFAFQLFGNAKSGDGRSKVTDTVINLKTLPRLDPGLTLIKGGVNHPSRSRSITLSTKVLQRGGGLQDDTNNSMELGYQSVSLGQGRECVS
ncbi:unnamed protein product [Linum trigynum]|uniref:Uncharacterized protein n=1 Tax=Linum trigynum TaxID=586398 RepID=A0AAV2CNB0_9ROSI